ncbi:MAG: XRE family transcriptional regulator [Pseudonocardiaceae bacterium]
MTGPEQGKRSFGDKLAYLIETVHPLDRGPYSYREIAAGIAGHLGAMTAAHINQLVRGKQPHPRIHHVEALAFFFGVPVNYFFDDEFAARIDDPILSDGAQCDEQVQQIAQRVVELAPRDRNAVLNLIDRLRAYDDEHHTSPGVMDTGT